MIDIILGILFIILGVTILIFYSGLKKNEKNAFTFKLVVAGIGGIIVGLGLMIREIF